MPVFNEHSRIFVSNIAIAGAIKTKYKRSASPVFEGEGSDGTVGYLSSDGSSTGKSTKTPAATGGSDSDEVDSDDSDNLPIVHYHKIAKKLDTSSESSSWDSSDSEPLVKYKRDSGRSSKRTKRRGVGRPKGHAKAPRRDFSRPQSIRQHKVRRDRVDEECERLGIYYKIWQPLNPEQTSHISVRDVNDDTVIPEEQEIPQWCILCPKNRVLPNYRFAVNHYCSVHQSTLLVVNETKMWACKCSEMRSHGSDNSARNKHYHCLECFHPFKTSDLLGTHISTQHTDIGLFQIRHLMKPGNPHRLDY